MFEAFVPRHAKRYADIGAALGSAMEQFVREIKDGTYPGPEHSFKIKREALTQFLSHVEDRSSVA